MATDLLTEAKIRTLKATERPYKAFDGSGMYLHVMPNGGTHWRLKYRLNGKERTYSMGSWPEVTLSEARRERTKARALIRSGVDPVDSRRQERKPEAPIVTVKSVIREWHNEQTKQMTERHRDQIWRTLDLHLLPEMGDEDADQLTAVRALEVIRIIEAKGIIETSKRCRMWASAAWCYAIANGVLKVDPWASIIAALTPRKRVQNFKSMSLNEARQLYKSLDDYRGERKTALGLRLLMLTWVRTKEVRYAKWNQIDFDSRLWTLPAESMKMNFDHLVPLSQAAIDVLLELQTLTGRQSLMFPQTRTPSKPVSENTFLYALYRYGFHDRATVHGFRSLASTVANETGAFREDAIERQLAHVPKNKVRAAYNRAAYIAERKHMVDWWADALTK